MKVVVQRVSEASVNINGQECQSIGKGFMTLVGIEDTDSREDVDYLIKKVSKLRVFEDKEGKMNLSIKQVEGEILSISQFTLHADTRKGNRPSFIKAAKPELAIPLYQAFNEGIEENGVTVKTGKFGAEMQVSLINDGPVTIIMDSKNR